MIQLIKNQNKNLKISLIKFFSQRYKLIKLKKLKNVLNYKINLINLIQKLIKFHLMYYRIKFLTKFKIILNKIIFNSNNKLKKSLFLKWMNLNLKLISIVFKTILHQIKKKCKIKNLFRSKVTS